MAFDPFTHLKRHEKEVAERKAAEAEAERRRDLRRAVREVIPKYKQKAMPKRGRGRNAIGGVSKREVTAMEVRADEFLAGEEGLRKLEREVQRRALVILQIDGVLGTEPWRAAHGLHGALIPANARLRYLDNALRILEDMRKQQGRAPETKADRLLEGVIDAEPADPKPEPA